jgi:hypothetical protein
MTARVPFGLTRLSCSGVYQGVRANMEPTSACIGLDQYSRGSGCIRTTPWKLFRTAVASLQPGNSGDYAAYFRGSGRSCPDCR